MSTPQHVIGIDLGTTHCALAHAEVSGNQPALLSIPQRVSVGEIESRALLPSFLYLPHDSDDTEDPIVGEFAKRRSATIPTRVVSSAKSWLCHPGIDRRAPILPADAPAEVTRLNPVEVSARYLFALREAWEQQHPNAPIFEQDVTLTVPASFDPVARDLTAEAARAAGIEQLTLLEEPQAALYQWLSKQGDRWRELLRVGDIVLVVDIGGGTTDFSLVDVRERDGNLELHRLAVGDHVLLGGDNMDLALAHLVIKKLGANASDRWLLRALTQACREGKESLLTDLSRDQVPITVPSRGAKLVGSVMRSELLRAEVEAVLLHGFFKSCPLSSRPSIGPMGAPRSAISELGLPYAKDPAVLSHLATFLTHHASSFQGGNGNVAANFVPPTAILFNGGVFKAKLLRDRVSDVVNQWLEEAGFPQARVLEGADYDHACALGATAFGLSRRSGGLRIRGGSPRSFYLGVEASMPAIPGLEPPITLFCMAPKGLEASPEVEPLPHDFALVVGEPVRFRFFSSRVRPKDVPGTTLDLANTRQQAPDQVNEHAPLEITLPSGERPAGSLVPVRLSLELTETGTFELYARANDGGDRWRVTFDVSQDPSNAPS